MKQKFWIMLGLALLFIGAMIASFFVYVYGHEMVHVSNAKYIGCNATVNFDVTTVVCPEGISEAFYLAEYEADARLEFFDHVFNSVINFFGMIVLGFIIFKFFRMLEECD